jgi:hypothetical protein
MADIVLYDEAGEPVTYENVETLTTDTPTEGETVTFTLGEVMDGLEVELNLADGNQTVTVPEGKLLKNLTIKKPDTLSGDNIAKGIEIAGVTGTLDGISIERIAKRDITGEVGSDTLETIGSYAFFGTGITSAAFPKCSVVNDGIFGYCSNLESIELNYSQISAVGERAFANTKIKSFSAELCSGSIKTSAFSGCSNLVNVYLPSCKNIWSNAFNNCSSLKNVTFAAGYSVVEEGTFQNCVNLEEFSYTVTKAYSKAFMNCKKLSYIKFHDANCHLGSSAFYGCENLETISGAILIGGFMDNLEIGIDAFYGCSKLKSITLGTMISGMEPKDNAFRGCKALSQFYLHSSTKVFSITTNWFVDTPLSSSSYLGKYGSIYVPSSLYYSFRRASGWSEYSARMVSYSM